MANSYVCEGADHKFNYTFFAEGFLDIYTKKCQMPILSNGKIVLLNNTIGAIATYKCFDGFTLTGPQITQCLSTGQWSSLRPQCRHLSTQSRCNKKIPAFHFVYITSSGNCLVNFFSHIQYLIFYNKTIVHRWIRFLAFLVSGIF